MYKANLLNGLDQWCSTIQPCGLEDCCRAGPWAGSNIVCQDQALGLGTARSLHFVLGSSPRGWCHSLPLGLGPRGLVPLPPTPTYQNWVLGVWHCLHPVLHVGIRPQIQSAEPGAPHQFRNLAAGEQCQCSPTARFPDQWAALQVGH